MKAALGQCLGCFDPGRSDFACSTGSTGDSCPGHRLAPAGPGWHQIASGWTAPGWPCSVALSYFSFS